MRKCLENKMVKERKNLCYYILGISVLLFGIIMAVLYSIPVISNGLVFSLYTLTGMMLPGYALVNLLNIECKTDVELITYTIFGGYFVSFVEYFFIVPFKMQDYAFLIWLFFVAISVLYLLLKKKKCGCVSFGKRDCFGMWVCLIVFFVVLCIKVGVYSGTSMLPYDKVEVTGIHEDLTYWMGNTVELTKRFPPFNFRHYGAHYNYHYFTSVQMAGMSLMTKISPVLLSLGFSIIHPSLMLAFGGYVAFSKCTSNNYLKLGGVVASLFTAGFSDFTDNRYAGYIFEYPFGFDYGMGIFMFLTFLVMKEFYEKRIYFKNLSIIAVTFILLCGVKATFGAMALVGMGVCCLRWILMKEQRKKGILLGGAALIIFGLMYFFVTNIKGYVANISEAFEGSNLLTNGNGYGDGRLSMLYMGMLSHGLPSPLAAGLITVIYVLFSNPLVFVIMVYQVIRAMVNRRRLEDGSLCLISMVAVGTFICVFIGMYGWSERYFMYNTFPIGAMFVVLNWQTDFVKTKLNVLKLIFVFILFVISFLGLVKYDGRLSLIEDTVKGYSRYGGSDYYKETRDTITKKQLEAYLWLSEEAYRYDLVGTNRQSPDKEIGALSECNVVDHHVLDYTLEWLVYIKEDGGELNKIFEKEKGFHLAFENEEVEIWKR